MSKAGAPRPRYVAFRIKAPQPISRRALATALKGRARHEGIDEAHLPQLTRFEYPHGIVQCQHTHLRQVQELLPRITWVVEAAAKVPASLTPLLSSGTIKTLTDRLGILAKRGTPTDKGASPRQVGIGPGRDGRSGGRQPAPRRSGGQTRTAGSSGAPRQPRRHQGF